jgi:transposase-like protein
VEYSEAFRRKMVQRMTGPRARSANALASEVGVPQPTLSRWLKEATTVRAMTPKEPTKTTSPAPRRRPEDWTPEEKLRAVVETSELSDAELGAYLRREGLHEAQLDEWRKAITEALAGPKARSSKPSGEAKRVRELERELVRKDKALAETAALLVLQKKLRAYYGGEDDDTEPKSGQ